jgi:hypothetical protein
VHQRRGGQSICIGAQLGRDAATPADLLTEAGWLAVAFGATGITHWGYQFIHLSQFEYNTGGKEAWDALERLNRELYTRHGRLATSWEPVPRRTAFWLSQCDLSHRGTAPHGFGFAVAAAERIYRALLTTGEPVDIVYDEDVLDGHLASYELLVVPGLRTLTESLAGRLKTFIGKGGIVVAPGSFDLPGLDGVHTAAINEKDRTKARAMTPPERRAWLYRAGRQIIDTSGIEPRVGTDVRHVVVNLMRAGDEMYLVLVNDNRTYGPWAATHDNSSEDRGLPATVKVSMRGLTAVTDMDTGESLPVEEGRFGAELEPGWGKIFRVAISP